MNPSALLALLASRGYLPAAAPSPGDWHDLSGPAGTLRIITRGSHIKIHGLGPAPARIHAFTIQLSDGTPEPVITATLNAAEAWLAFRDTRP